VETELLSVARLLARLGVKVGNEFRNNLHTLISWLIKGENTFPMNPSWQGMRYGVGVPEVHQCSIFYSSLLCPALSCSLLGFLAWLS
jgi:hypothetical protein